MNKNFIERVDNACFYELHSTNYMIEGIYYRVYNRLPNHIWVVFSDNIYDMQQPDYDVKDDQVRYTIDKGKTHQNFIDKGYIFKNLDFDFLYFNEDMMITLDYETCTVYCDDYIKAKEVQDLIVFKKSENEQSIGILNRTPTGYDIQYVNYSRMNIDINKNYNDDLIKLALPKIKQFITKDETGLALFYGEPGTGKTSFLKYLIQEYQSKNFVILDSDLLEDITSKQLLSTFIDQEDTIYIIEDAEKLLKTREHNFNPIINSFLNMSDGILASVIKSKFICTFNTSLSNIDDALKRKGRMKVKYEFKKLKVDKVKKFIPDATHDMSLADIFNHNEENDFSKQTKTKIGF